MSSLILRAATRVLAPMMLMLSLFLLWRGHNLPGGGFIGGLVATSAIALQGIAFGPEAARRTLVLPPAVLAGVGLVAAVLVAGRLCLQRGCHEESAEEDCCSESDHVRSLRVISGV